MRSLDLCTKALVSRKNVTVLRRSRDKVLGTVTAAITGEATFGAKADTSADTLTSSAAKAAAAIHASAAVFPGTPVNVGELDVFMLLKEKR